MKRSLPAQLLPRNECRESTHELTSPVPTKGKAVHCIDLMPDGKHRQYSSIQECKSVVTASSGGQVLSKCLTRFNIDWVWDGKPARVQSLATDETGYLQPTFRQLCMAHPAGGC